MSERKRDYPSGAEKRKSKRKREEVIKKVPKISSFFHRQDTVSDLDWKENDDNVPKEIKICESFLGFIAVTDCSAAGLKTAFLNLTKEYGIDLTKCRGQGYDGANVMSGIYGGLQTLIKEHAPNADYVHCAAHALNLVLNDAARHVREISTFFDNLEKVYTFFGNSIKRWAMLSDDPSEKYLITLKKTGHKWITILTEVIEFKTIYRLGQSHGFIPKHKIQDMEMKYPKRDNEVPRFSGIRS
ncbi:unnamed protein product [Acanthoscelides obtectus]|uniref:DUF4371 domain-containing protein n=1 Tax=Acanthoscelides obtectus TaxID=200917 RepID=A0A9P0PC70_ACAOB|nr:unnamed protein product [Acanthoscelides obtectus]CAK1638630.1 Zinc finger MYM-type protein 1 [Acanthoscelides obtectus]